MGVEQRVDSAGYAGHERLYIGLVMGVRVTEVTIANVRLDGVDVPGESGVRGSGLGIVEVVGGAR